MTVHQAKGLQFPVVFVTKIGIQQVSVDAALQLEDQLRPFRTNPIAAAFTAQQRAEQDYIRFFYVAYSRAQYSLVLLATVDELREQGLGFGGYGRPWFLQQVDRIS
jgi:DNA helicase II / ATP-dependent DNA helicase PcrA